MPFLEVMPAVLDEQISTELATQAISTLQELMLDRGVQPAVRRQAARDALEVTHLLGSSQTTSQVALPASTPRVALEALRSTLASMSAVAATIYPAEAEGAPHEAR
jgi:hypothetical protein